MTRPNVLFIITDQHRADHVGFGGNDVVRTPNLDALAERSVVFDRAYVANPICAPNRSTIVTGRYPSAHGVVFNDRSLPLGGNTWPRVFRRAGYRTGLIGKAHLMMWRSAARFDHGPGDAAVFDPSPPGWDRHETASLYADGRPEPPDDFYGFDEVQLALGHGASVAGHHLHWAIDRGIDPATIEGATLVDGPAEYRSARWAQILKPAYGAEHHSTEFVTDRTIDFIERHDGERPWLAYASFPDPHHPFAPPGDWFDRHRQTDMVLPPTFHDDLDGAPGFLTAIAGRPGEPAIVTPWRPTEEQFRELLAAQYGAIEMIDAGVGRILAAVEALGQRDDTIVVFTSDHGDMMGDHGLLLKGMQHWEGTTRVPYVIDSPTNDAARTSSLASSVDLGQTLLDLAGLEPYRNMQGSSLVPILDDPSTSVRDHVLIEEEAPAVMGGRGRRRVGIPARARTVVTDTMRFTRYSTGESQLFDLSDDPLELHDRSAGDRRRVGELTTLLVDTMMAVATPAPAGADPDAG
ncbi:MAG: sulfatase-like hydrolase/transferase [Actinomycetota bacterium]